MKNKYIKLLLLTVSAFGLNGCTNDNASQEVLVKNPSDFSRSEVVSIDATSINNAKEKIGTMYISVIEIKSGKQMVTQWVDNDSDETFDQLLFQADIEGRQQKVYKLEWTDKPTQVNTKSIAYSRFVPERIDDYAWENDRVAFRTYGPEAQRLVDEDEPGGTLSSGIDLWLKRVNYSIIDKWYGKNTKEPGYYHIDHGEGCDSYHVGISRGAGGIGIWINDTLITSKNFIAYRTLANGPLRTVFELDYAPWSEFKVKETKRISLDVGSNFSKFEIGLAPSKPVPNYTVGITMHEKEGNARLDDNKGLYSYWEANDTSSLGVGVIIDPNVVLGAKAYSSSTPDQSQILVQTDPKQQTLTYYVGFGWTRSGQVSDENSWMEMLNQQKEIIENPFVVVIK